MRLTFDPALFQNEILRTIMKIFVTDARERLENGAQFLLKSVLVY